MKTVCASLLVITACSSIETADSEQDAIVKQDTSARWRIDADGTYTVKFYVNPKNGTPNDFAIASPGSKCSTNPSDPPCLHGVALRQALDEYERLTSIRFEQIAAPLPASSTTNYLHIIDCNAGTSHNYGPASVDDDPKTLEELRDCDQNITNTLFVRSGPDDSLVVLRKDVDFTIGVTPVPFHIPLHEIGHALNFAHENKRDDAPSAGVLLTTACVGGDMDAFTPDTTNTHNLTPYDVDSMMEYPSTTKCLRGSTKCKDSSGNPVAGGDGCSCFPLLRDPSASSGTLVTCDVPGGGTQTGRLIEPRGDFSDEDLNALYQMYPPRVGTSVQDDRFGEAMAAGDFDGDGYDDLAVGAPGDRNGGPAAGAIYLFKGTQNGLQPWRKIMPAMREEGDEFGAALAAGKLDGDARDDLVVGAPNLRPHAGGPRSGGVFVYYGQRSGLGDEQLVHQESLYSGYQNETGDRFGAALAIGNLGAETSEAEIAIGAPFDLGGGRVYVAKRSGNRYTRFERLGELRANGDRFGTAIHAANFGDGSADELFIGSPEDGTSNGAGHVYGFRAGTTSMTALITLSEPGAAAGDRFGTALASGNFAQDGVRKLVVGAPSRSTGRGAVYLMKIAFANGNASLVSTQSVPQPYDQTHAAFGRTLAVADFNGDDRDDLAVGVPLYDSYTLVDNGVVVLIPGFDGTLDVANAEVRFAAAGHGNAESFDAYGRALAVGNFNTGSNIDLAVGAPGRDPGNLGDDYAGAVWPLRGYPGEMPKPTGNADAFTDYLDQEFVLQR